MAGCIGQSDRNCHWRLRLGAEGEDVRPQTIEQCDRPEDIDYVEAALAWHDGDARATIATLIADCRHLRRQLVLAEGLVSRGMMHGFKPSFERE
jgi:hypothetical protein